MSAPHSPTQSSRLDQRFQFYGNCITACNQKKTPEDFITKFITWSRSYSIDSNDPCHKAILRIALKELQFSEDSEYFKKSLRGFIGNYEQPNFKYVARSLIAHRKRYPNAQCMSKEIFEKLVGMDVHAQVTTRGHFFREVRNVIDTKALQAFEKMQIAATEYQIEFSDPLVTALSVLALKNFQPADKRFEELAKKSAEIETFLASTLNACDVNAFIINDRFLQLGI